MKINGYYVETPRQSDRAYTRKDTKTRQGLLDSIKDSLGIKSPSKTFLEFARNGLPIDDT